MKKRFLAALLALCMVFALGTVSALATDGESTTKLPAADDGVITLNNDIIVSGIETLNLSQNSLETNGYSITVTGTLTVTGTGSVTNDVAATKDDVKGIFIVDGGTLNIQSGTFETAGAEVIRVNEGTANVSGGTFKCTATNVSLFDERVMFMVSGSQSKLNFTAGTIEADSLESSKEHGLYGVYPANGATVVLGTLGGGNQPTIKTDFSAIALNNTTSEPALKVTVNSGYYKSGLDRGNTQKENCVIYLPGQCEFVINGGTFVTADTNASVISIPYPGFGVDLDINNGTFDASSGNAIVKTWGVDLGTDDDDTPNNVSISGGKFTSGSEFADFNENEKLDDFITGGTFKTSAGAADTSVKVYIPESVSMKFDETTGKVVVDDTKTVATVDGVGYPTLQAAIDAAEEGDTVELKKDIPDASVANFTGNGQAVFTIKTDGITLDGNNHKITVTGNKADNVSTHVISINDAANVTVENLVLDGGKAATSGVHAFKSTNVKFNNITATNFVGAGSIVNGSTVIATNFNTSGNGWGGVNVDSKDYADTKFTLKSGTVQSVYTDSISTTEPTDIVIDGGTVGSVGIVAAGKNSVVINDGYVETVGASVPKPDITVTGGTFGASVKDYVDVDDFKYELETADGEFSYYETMSAALSAAGDEDEITYIGSTTETVTHEVTFVYNADRTVTVTVPDETDIKLPSASRVGVKFLGWSDGWRIYDAGDEYTVDDDVTFTAVWEAAAYDIVIDDDILHGDIWTSPKSEAEAGDTVHVYADPDAGYVLEDLSVTYRSGRYELKLTRVSANHYTFTMPAYNVYVTAEFTSDGFPFDDVRSNQWFYDAVYYVWANDLMEGVDYDEFNPNGTMTRAMFWAVLGRIDGETITGSDWADEARDWAMSEGVSDGTDPNGLVTREQMVTMLWRYAGERDGSGNLSRYTDGDKVAQYATEAMRWALGNGIIEGTTATTLEPQATATRAQCAAIFMRYYE